MIKESISRKWRVILSNYSLIQDATLSILDAILQLIKAIPTFAKGFRKESDKKQWIKPREYSKYVSIVAWITDSKELKPYYNLFIKRMSNVISKNSST
jgi:hypothetical protein